MTTEGPHLAGWYADPYDSRQLRYWDGAMWTESVTPASGQDVQRPVPPFGPPGGAQSGAEPGPGSGLGDLGSWLSATFSTVFDRIAPVTILLIAIPLAGFTAVAILIVLAVGDLEWHTTTDDVVGFRAPLLVAAVVAVLAAYAVLGITYLAATHQLWAAHIGAPQSVGRSLSLALRRLPRTIVYGLLLGLAATAMFGALLILPIILAVQETAFLALFVLTVPMMIVAGVFFWVRLSMFGVATVVAPSGANPISVSWRLTSERFWGFFGRIALLTGLVYVLQSIVSGVLQLIAAPLIQASMGFEVDPVTGEALLNGQPFDTFEVVRVADLFPNFGLLIGFFVLSLTIQGVTQAVTLSGSASLYVRAGGPGEV